MRESFDALVIRVCDYKENDRLLTVLCADKGKCTLIAKGARSVKSNLLSVCRQFTYANFEMYEKNGMRWLSGGSINTAFFSTVEDIEKYALASYIGSLAEEITGEGVPCENVLRMTLNTLYAIENGVAPNDEIKAVYEIFAAAEMGFSPNLEGCHMCKRSVDGEECWLDVMNGSLVCSKCRTKLNSLAASQYEDRGAAGIIAPLSVGVPPLWRHIADLPVRRAFSVKINDTKLLSSLSNATETYIVNHLERGFSTLDFYHDIKDIK